MQKRGVEDVEATNTRTGSGEGRVETDDVVGAAQVGEGGEPQEAGGQEEERPQEGGWCPERACREDG